MNDIIKKFVEKAQTMGNRNFFNQGLSREEIAVFEKALQDKFGIVLPPLMVAFYEHFNGGYFADASWSEEELTDPKKHIEIAHYSNVFLSLQEIVSCKFFNIQEVKEETGQTVFPIIDTRGHEALVIENGKNPIIDAFHEAIAFPEDWGEIYPSFEDLLNAYIETEGNIQTIG